MEELEQKNRDTLEALEEGNTYKYELPSNGDTQKQLLARSRYLLFKSKTKWTLGQKERAEILFILYPNIEKVYNLAQGLTYIFENNTHEDVARLKLAHWYTKVKKNSVQFI